MIFSNRKNFINNLCKYVGMEEWQITDFLMRGERNYTKHFVKCKQKVRVVFEPNETLKKMQIFAIRHVFQKYPVSKFSTAYEKQCSIKKNAQQHQNSKFLAHFDIHNFFASLNFELFSKLLSKKHGSHEIKILWLICSNNEGLPIGAYSSPFVANRVLWNMDKALGAAFRGVTYTRYADDLIFSSKRPLPPELGGFLSEQLHKFRLELNHKKTYRRNAKSPKKVTGVTITQNQKLTVGKRFKLQLKKQLYNLTVKKQGNKAKVMGKLNFIRHIEPLYYNKLRKKYNI